VNVLILGSGVIGVTNAWYLARSGHQVTVIERQSDVALETSFANAGQISPGYSAPWAAPGVPIKAMKWLLQDLSPLRINPTSDIKLYAWMTRLLLNCNAKSYRINKERMLRIAQYSRDSLQILSKELSLDYDQGSQGTLQIFRHEKQMLLAQNDIKILDECDINYQLLNSDECIDYEPALSSMGNKLIGGLRLPEDETGDCYRFTQSLAQKCKSVGVRFMFEHEILSLETKKGNITKVNTNKGNFSADAYVMALGSYSASLLKTLSINLPVYPVKGYSLTAPIKNAAISPISTVMDETYKVAVTRFNNRIRVGGTAELTGFNLDLPFSRHENLNFVINDLFPDSVDMSQAQYWTGLRPMTPDGTPILGACSIKNLYINTGHGTLGWTMAVGSARYVTDIINGTKPEINTEGLSLARYG